MFRISMLVLPLALLFSAQSGFTQAKKQGLTGQSFSGEITVKAPPSQVWAVLTDAGQLTEVMGYEYAGGTRKFNKVGSSAQVKAWGDNGNFTLVRSNHAKELRFNLDPENGSYICGCQWKLSAAGNGTKIWFEERYTESAPQSKEDLEAQVKDTNKMLRRLKMKAEGK